MLIAARAVMGVGGAFIMPSTLSILTNVFPAGERAKAIGIWAASPASASRSAPSPAAGCSSTPTGAGSSSSTCRSSSPRCARRALVPESRDPAAPPLDLLGFALSTAGLTALVWAIIEAPGRGWTDPAILAGFAAAALALGAFAAWELRAPHPMLDVRLFRNPRFSASSVAISLAFFALFGMIFFLTQYLQLILGYSAFEAGLRTLPVAGGLVLGGPLSASSPSGSARRSSSPPAWLVVGAGLALLGFADADSGYGLVAASLVVLGFGMGMAMAPATDAIMGSLPLAKASVGSAVNDATRTTGGALGVAVLGSVLSSGYRGGMEDAVAGTARARRRRGAATRWPAGSRSPRGSAARPGSACSTPPRTRSCPACTRRRCVAAGVALAGSVVALVLLPARGGRGRGRRRRAARPSGSSSPHERDRRAHARAAPLRRGRPARSCARRSSCSSSDGYRALTMEQVRERAGVGKATLYRRYGSKEELVRAAVAHLHPDLPVPEDTGSLAATSRRSRESRSPARSRPAR